MFTHHDENILRYLFGRGIHHCYSEIFCNCSRLQQSPVFVQLWLTLSGAYTGTTAQCGSDSRTRDSMNMSFPVVLHLFWEADLILLWNQSVELQWGLGLAKSKVSLILAGLQVMLTTQAINDKTWRQDFIRRWHSNLLEEICRMSKGKQVSCWTQGSAERQHWKGCLLSSLSFFVFP